MIILLFACFVLASCVDKEQNKKKTEVNSEEVIQLEKENEEIEVLEVEINEDIKELDELLEDLDNI